LPVGESALGVGRESVNVTIVVLLLFFSISQNPDKPGLLTKCAASLALQGGEG